MKDIVIGKTQELTVLRESEHGLYLGNKAAKRREIGAGAEEAESVLLPKGQVTDEMKIGAKVRVFVYRDSEDRPVATVRTPVAEVGQFAYVKVKSVTRIGSFLDWGLEKDLFLPYKETEEPLKSGDRVLVYLYLDKSDRISATTKLYSHLIGAEQTGYRKEDPFAGAVYRVNQEVGVFTAVCPKGELLTEGRAYTELYFGLVPPTQVFARYRVGDAVEGRIVRVREDGKLDLALRKRDFEQLEADGAAILRKMDEYGGTLPFSENASPELIKRELKMSKSAFKKALGHLYKGRKIRIGENEVTPYRP